MKGRHVVLLMFVLGLGLLAVLFRSLDRAVRTPPPSPPPAAPPISPDPPPPAPETAGSIEVTVRSGGAPVIGASVTFHGPRTILLTTGAGGKCLVPVADRGPWRIVARAANLEAASTQVEVETGRQAVAVLELEAGVRLEGTVRDESGRPVAGAFVSIGLSDPALTSRTDANGRYQIRGIPLGTFSVTASIDHLRPDTKAQVAFSVPGETLVRDFLLAAGSAVAGTVVDEAGVPVSRAAVIVSNEVARMVRTDGMGRFEAAGLGDGPLTIRVTVRGFAPSTERGVAPGRTDLVIRLARGGSIQGTVDDPPATYTVHLSRYDEGRARWNLVKSEAQGPPARGSFHLRDLAAGRYEISIESADRRTPFPLQADVAPGQTVDLRIVLLVAK
jgi:hypothetical protein